MNTNFYKLSNLNCSRKLLKSSRSSVSSSTKLGSQRKAAPTWKNFRSKVWKSRKVKEGVSRSTIKSSDNWPTCICTWSTHCHLFTISGHTWRRWRQTRIIWTLSSLKSSAQRKNRQTSWLAKRLHSETCSQLDKTKKSWRNSTRLRCLTSCFRRIAFCKSLIRTVQISCKDKSTSNIWKNLSWFASKRKLTPTRCMT